MEINEKKGYIYIYIYNLGIYIYINLSIYLDIVKDILPQKWHNNVLFRTSFVVNNCAKEYWHIDRSSTIDNWPPLLSAEEHMNLVILKLCTQYDLPHTGG